jgi:Cof subfamily protein (haloacid dehalogenase superfamily)
MYNDCHMIKAVFFDIDGTLLAGDTHTVPKSAQDALHKLHDKGIYLFIASGRPPVQLEILPEELKNLPFDGWVFLNGQYCTDSKGKVLHEQTIEKESLKTLVPWLKKQEFACTIYELNYGYNLRFNEHEYQYLKSIGREDFLPPVEDPIRALSHDTYQICPVIPPEEDAEFLKHAPGMESARWTESFADMIPAGGGKPRGLQAMGEAFGFGQEEMMAFGDAGNDAGMLKYARIGVAMGNGTDAAKNAADYITTYIHEDGIANALKHFGLIA